MLRKYGNFRTSGPDFTQAQSEFAKMVQNLTLQSEHMETVCFDQNMTLQHMEAMLYASIRASPFESHSGLLRSEHHQIPKPRLSNLLHCYNIVLPPAATTLQGAADPVHACVFLKPHNCTKLAYKNCD